MNLQTLAVLALTAAVGILVFDRQNPPPTATEIRFVSDDSPRQERIMTLPEDGDLWSTIVVYGGESKQKGAENRTLAANFETTPRLQSLRGQTKFFEMSPDNWWVKRYHPGEPLPLVILQAQDGRTIYKNAGDSVPRDGETLADEIEQRIADCCPNVKPQPDDKPDPTFGRIPILRPQSTPAQSPESLFAIIACLAVGAGAALLHTRSAE